MNFRLERSYQPDLIRRIEEQFPGAMLLKNDPHEIQGIPDLLILHGRNWAMLETKRQPKASQRPNQAYYIDLFNRMSFASFINPRNEREVLDGIRSAFTSF